jgi:hypothetical protein
MIVASFFLFNKDTHHPSLLTLIPVVGTMLIIWFANPTDFSTRILSTSVFVSIGLISYGIYMWHFPIFAFSNIVLAEQLLAPIKLGLIAAVIGISALSYVFIEKPFRTTSIISTKTAMLVGTIVLIPLTVFLYNGMENGYKHRVPALLNAATELEYIPNTTWFETTTSRTAKKIAEDFFFQSKPLPNRRIKPYLGDMNQYKLDSLFSDPNLFINGLADKIAAHLMVNGTFNINSTSVEAWKAVFSSLKGKPVAYLDKDTALTDGVSLKEDRPSGVPIGLGGAANAKSYKNSSSDPSDPEQWIGWRDLTDEEIKQLAIAMVKQVKLRGPFLSLSEFVNRRLDSTNPTLSVKGALQAALDDAHGGKVEPAMGLRCGLFDKCQKCHGSLLKKNGPRDSSDEHSNRLCSLGELTES